MSDRFMRLLVLFDLPTETSADRREYTRFRKFLIKNGFVMMQESVYCRMAVNATAQTAMINAIRKHKPPKGVVQLLSVTERQYARMEYLVGDYNGDIIQSDERLIEL